MVSVGSTRETKAKVRKVIKVRMLLLLIARGPRNESLIDLFIHEFVGWVWPARASSCQFREEMTHGTRCLLVGIDGGERWIERCQVDMPSMLSGLVTGEGFPGLME